MSERNCQVLYAKYNSVRRPEFRVTTEICEDLDGVFVRKRAGTAEARAHLEAIYKNAVDLKGYYRDIQIVPVDERNGELRFPFISGQTLAEQIDVQHFDRERFIAQVNQKLDLVLAVQDRYAVPFEPTEAFETLFGKVDIGGVPALNPANIDVLLTNFVENESGIYCIDCEWVCHFPVPVDYIRYRILLYLYVNQIHNQFSELYLEEMLGWFGFSERECEMYWQMDDRFQQHVHGANRKYIYLERYRKKNLFPETMVQEMDAMRADVSVKRSIIHDKDVHIGSLEQEMDAMRANVAAKEGIIHDKDVHIGSLEQEMGAMRADVAAKEGIIHDKDVHIGSLEQEMGAMRADVAAKEGIIHDKDVHIGNLNGIIHDKDVHIQNLSIAFETVTNSFSWRATKPARVIMDAIKRQAKKNESVYLFLRTVKDTLRHGGKYARERREAYLAEGDKALRHLNWPTGREMARQRRARFPRQITFSILVPLYNTPDAFLKEMIQSVRNQTYGKWELCLADGSDEAHASVERICRGFAKRDRRIRYRKLEKNLGISGNTNACIEMATGDYIALFDHDDLLNPSALYEVMKAICEQDADYIYTDEATFESPDIHKIITLHFKPDFAPDNLLANNYICHFSVFSARLLKNVGGFRPEYDGSQDHDMILRLTAEANRIVHIPKILYLWRAHPQSVSQNIDAKQYAVDSAKRAVHDFLRDYRHVEARIESTRAFPTIFQIIYPVQSRPRVSIVIPNKDHVDDLDRCVRSIQEKSTYDNYEIVIVENNSESEETFAYYSKLEREARVRVLRYDGKFNYSKINNWAVDQCDADYIVLLNNDTEVITPDWLENLLMYAQREDVGAVGAKLYFPDGRIQHAGVVIKMGDDRIAAHAYYGAGHDHIGYMGRLCYAQDASAVTGACLMIRRRKYMEVGGLDEGFAVAYNDVDFCLKLRAKGYLNIFTPFAELYHHESASRGYETGEKLERFKRECALFKSKWADVLEAGDPFFNPNLSLDSPMFEPKKE